MMLHVTMGKMSTVLAAIRSQNKIKC